MVKLLIPIITDDELTSRIIDDDQYALKLLFDRYNRKIYYFSYKYLHNKVEAEDLVQNLFINLWLHRKSLITGRPVKSYIYKSVVNMIYNCLRKRAVRERHIENELKNSEYYSNQTYDIIYRNELEKNIDEIVTRLPAQQQRIFYMSRVNGYSYEKIARKLDISVRTVENQIYRTLKVIKNKLKLVT